MVPPPHRRPRSPYRVSAFYVVLGAMEAVVARLPSRMETRWFGTYVADAPGENKKYHTESEPPSGSIMVLLFVRPRPAAFVLVVVGILLVRASCGSSSSSGGCFLYMFAVMSVC